MTFIIIHVLYFTLTIKADSEFQNKIFHYLFYFKFIRNNIYTLTYGVRMVVDECSQMDVNGCGWAHLAWGDIKRSQEESKMVTQGIFSALWPGKFPRTSCFAMADKKWRRCMLTGKNGLAWVRWGAGARRDRKTREKEGWMIEKDMFWDA